MTLVAAVLTLQWCALIVQVAILYVFATRVRPLVESLTRMEAQMRADVQALNDGVAELETVQASVDRFVDNLVAELTALKDAPTPEAIQALTDRVAAVKASLAADLLKNTPAEPTA